MSVPFMSVLPVSVRFLVMTLASVVMFLIELRQVRRSRGWLAFFGAEALVSAALCLACAFGVLR